MLAACVGTGGNMELYTILDGIQSNRIRSVDFRWFQGMEHVRATVRVGMASIFAFLQLFHFVAATIIP